MNLSVIVPQALHDSRRNISFLRSWVEQIGVESDDYEIVVAINAQHPDIVDQVRSLVREHDRVIATRGDNEIHYYELGVQAARGRLLLFTEDHVYADPNCVREVLNFFAQSTSRAAILRSEHSNSTRFARHEAQLYDAQLQKIWLQPDCWDRVHLRGCVIERELLRAIGDVPWQYGLFSARLMGARLHKQQETVEYCPQAIIRHLNIPSPSQLQHDVKSYVLGECLYSDEQESLQNAELDLPPSLLSRHEDVRMSLRDAVECFANALKARRSSDSSPFDIREMGPLTSECMRAVFRSTLQHRIDYAKSVLGLARARIAYELSKFSRRRGIKAFDQLWVAMASYERAKYCRDHLPAIANASRVSTNAETTPVRWTGFHSWEYWQGRAFRWSRPIAMLDLSMGPGMNSIEIDTGGIRGTDCDFPFQLFVNGTAIAHEAIRRNAGRIEFSVPWELCRADGNQRVTIISSPLPHHAGDMRDLGVPVFDVSCRPLDYHMSAEVA